MVPCVSQALPRPAAVSRAGTPAPATPWPGAPSLGPSLARSPSAAVRTQVFRQPWRHASNKQQTLTGFMFSARGAARAPGLLRGRRGPGPSQAVTVLSRGPSARVSRESSCLSTCKPVLPLFCLCTFKYPQDQLQNSKLPVWGVKLYPGSQ